MDYYIASGNQRLGPFPFEQLRAVGLTPQTLVWREGLAEWTAASLIPELLPLFTAPAAQQFPPAPLPYAQPGLNAPPGFVPSQSNRILCGVMAIVFGQFGVHKFILGLTSGAVTMLCVTLGGFLGIFAFFCPPALILIFGPMAMHVIGIIEGIMYLSCSDQEFHLKYVVQKRQWF